MLGRESLCELLGAGADRLLSQRILLEPLHEIVHGVAELMPEDGLALHQIDCSDIHAQRDFRTVDRQLHPLYCLVFDDETWDKITPRDQGTQNRLREFEFVALFEKAGLDVIAHELVDPKADSTGTIGSYLLQKKS